MNVAFDPWIPVVTVSGEPKRVNLLSVFTEGEDYVDLAVRPHERVALMRLFICVAHAALDGPKDYYEWLETPKRLPEAADRYLSHWKDFFELFHEKRPWLQMAGLTKDGNQKNDDPENWTPVSKLNFSFATGNNTTLFDHASMKEFRDIGIKETLVSLLTFQCFSVGGLMGQVFWNGARCGELANPTNENGPVKSLDAPCVPASMVHALLRDKALSGTIHLNLPYYEDIGLHYGELSVGKPVWEMMPSSPADHESIKNATSTYLGRLVPMTRLIKLHPSGQRMLLGDGLAYPPFANGFPPEPTATVIIRKNAKKEERTLLSYRPSKALWRELGAIAVKRKAGETGGPLSLKNIQDSESCDLIVAALARDKATIVDTAESVFPASPQLLSSEGIITYQVEVKHAEAIAGRLGWAAETYRMEIDGGWEGRLKGAGPGKGELKAKLYSVATTHYWTAVEKNLPLLMAHIEALGSENNIPTREAWRKMLFRSACAAYRVACGQETPRQMRAFAKGWSKLAGKKEEKQSENINNEEVKNELVS